MTTCILTNYKVLTTGVEGGHTYLSTKIFYDGFETDLAIFFKDKPAEDLFADEPIIALRGNFKEEVNPFTITLFGAEQIDLPNGDNWLAFFINYFLENSVASLTIFESPDDFTISPNLEHHYIWSNLSKDKKTLHKTEFGRLLPIEKPEYKRKSTSWTKAVLLNNQDHFIEFMQSSWDGENGKKYQVEYNENNKKLVTTFLSIPFEYGWTEFDHRIGKDGFYKAGAKTVVDHIIFQNTFILLDIGEQDIPFATDKLDQWIRRKWGDSFINNYRRTIDETNIQPIKKHS